jgi:hypothetical protein
MTPTLGETEYMGMREFFFGVFLEWAINYYINAP